MIPLGTPPKVPEDGFVDVLALADLPVSAQRSVAHGIERILLCRTADALHAVADSCPHALQPLAGSDIEGGVIRCAKHGAQFDLNTGRAKNGVTQKALRVYPVRVRDGRIEIGVTCPRS